MTESRSLKVEKSPVKSGGRARVNTESIEDLEVDDGELIVVSSDRKDILVSVYGDDLINLGKIKLRKLDVEKLGVGEGQTVNIKKHKKLLNKLL